VDAYAGAGRVSRYTIGDNSLPPGVSMEDFLTRYGDVQYDLRRAS